MPSDPPHPSSSAVETYHLGQLLEAELAPLKGQRMTPRIRERVRALVASHGIDVLVLWLPQFGTLHLGPISASLFELMTGRAPLHDDLERANCTQGGTLGHLQCGICETHSSPRAVCGCVERQFGYRGMIEYMAEDFDAPLDDFEE